MSKSINLVAMLGVAGGLAAATLPSVARANCSPAPSPSSSSSGFSGASGGQVAPEIDFNAELASAMDAYTGGDFRKARGGFARLLPYAGKNASVYYLAGESRAQLGDFKGAVKLLEKAVKYDPTMLIAQQDLAVAYAKTGNTPKAQLILTAIEAQAAQCGGACDTAEPMAAAIATVKEAMAA